MRRFSLSSLKPKRSGSRNRKKSFDDGSQNEDTKVQELQRVIGTTHPGHLRQLPGHAHLHLIFGQRRLDRVTCKIDCDEVYPNVLIGDE